MIKDEKISIPYKSFPSQYVPDTVKESEDFGREIGQAIQYEWFKREGGQTARFYSRRDEFRRRRLYARAEQSVVKYKNELAVEGDMSYLNLDWTPVPIIPKFVDIVVNGMTDRVFTVKAQAQDALSQQKRFDFQTQIEAQMAAKEELAMVKEMFGVDPFTMNEEEVPADDDELSLYMQLRYKPAIEIAAEVGVLATMEENKYTNLRKRMDYDSVVLGVSVGRHEFLKGSGIKLSYVDPEYWIHSYTEDPFFSDCFYFGEVERVHNNELLKINPDLTQDDMKEISSSSEAWARYQGFAVDNSILSAEESTILRFNFKTTKKIVTKVKINEDGGERPIPKTDDWDPPQEEMDKGRFRKIEKTIDVWYEGVMVLGCDKIIKWELAENMVRPKSPSQHALPQYFACAPRMYKGEIESLTRRMIPFADSIQMTHLKLQQVVQKVTPDGVFIDADGLIDIDLGNGAAYNPNEALKLYFQTGSVVGRSRTEDGEFNHGRIPIQELNKSAGASKIQSLIANYNYYLDIIRQVTGLNEARDGSTPDPRALVGVQKLAALNSNTATRHVLDAGIYMVRAMAEACSYRMADIMKYEELGFKDALINKIGKYNTAILEEASELYLYDFGINIEVSPDAEEKASLDASVKIALDKGDINLEDAIDIREINNIKLANQLLKLKRVKKQEREEKAEMQKQAMASESNMKSQQMAAQTTAQKIQLEGETKMRLEKIKIDGEIAKMEREAALKEMLMDKEFSYNMRLAGVREDMQTKREEMKEEEKAKRIDKQSTNTSKIADQKKNNKAPINFESNEDTLDGFALDSFGPK